MSDITEKTEQPFDKLLSELDTFAKAMDKEDDANIAAAAGENQEDQEEDEDEGDEKEVMGKSFAFIDADGNEVEAIDGTELVKSLMARIDITDSTLTKALTTTIGLIGKQGEMIKSLQDEVKKLAGSGSGRKAVLSIVEKPAVGQMAKSEPAGMNGEQFMAKAMSMVKAGKLLGSDVARAGTYLNNGEPVPMDIVSRVLSN